KKAHHTRGKMRASLDYRNEFLCVLVANGIEPKKWYPVSRTDYAEVQTLLGRPLTSANLQEGIYVDEEGNVFQLLDKGEMKPIEVEHLPGTEKTKREALPEASLKGKKMHEQNGDSKRMQRKNRTNGGKQQALQVDSSAPQSLSPDTTASAEPVADAANGA